MSKKNPKAQNEVLVLKNQLIRALADYDNLSKRVESEQESWIKFSSERILLKLFPIIDILESAQEHLKDQGLAIAILEFKKILQEEGLEEINPKKGEIFNPEIHEAVESIEGGEKGRIAELVVMGWKFKTGKAIRVAKVKVFGEKVEKKEELEKELKRGEYN
ncbi:nucleotide exchange factor GrpE [Candidatus Woesebacteria bacterium RBG_13_34_9]|uniref:Protein GrpE n=1 Tax=Candidatus Woesebacteria bacterium RBG_13_34_9 TaxID=1802477 RepID=A0A1F7X5G9_9BACT|nr:MAG: nucleotide exchange factor GrpE [Candidatus Woesebacteria bacterium RBG_13_34_9]